MREFDQARKELAAAEMQIHPSTTSERLARRVQQLEEELASVKEARAILERNPDVERLLTLMGRVNY